MQLQPACHRLGPLISPHAILHIGCWPLFRFSRGQIASRMENTENGNRWEHRDGLKDVERPLVSERVAIDALSELDDTID